MSDQLPALATPVEVAEYLHTTTASLAQDRYRGTGPKFIKRGNRVLYRVVRRLGMVRTQHISTHRRSETAAVSDAVDQLAQALRDLINEAVQAAVERERAIPPPERPKVPDEGFDLCPWCNKKDMRHLMPVKEARQQLRGISHHFLRAGQERRTIARLGRPPLVRPLGRTRRFLRRKRYDASGRTETAG